MNFDKIYFVQPKRNRHVIIVGWDPEKKSYILRVMDNSRAEDDHRREVITMGDIPGDITDIEVLDVFVKDYSLNPNGLSSDMWQRLFDDAN